MAKLLLEGKIATVALASDPEDGTTVATCIDHAPDGWIAPECKWSERYDTLNDAAEYAADHADRGRV